MSDQSFLPQINICETLFGNTIENYDPEILKIRVYGTTENPLFMANDVFIYIMGSVLNKTHFLKKFIKPKELVKHLIKTTKTSKLDKKFKRIHDCNLFTLYGLMRFALSRNTDTVSVICFRRFVYALFDKIKNYPKILEEAKIAYHNDMLTPEVQSEIAQSKLPTVSVVYFIKNSRHTKIGYTSDLEKRLSSLQVGSSDELTVYKTINVATEHAPQLESHIHSIFTDFHIRGEWYDITNVQIANMNR
jgi:hypothetical protein